MSEPVVVHHREALSMRSLRGVLVCPPGTSQTHLVSTPGELIWELLDEPTTVTEIADRLADRFDTTPAEIHSDVAALLADLIALGAVHSVDDVDVDRRGARPE